MNSAFARVIFNIGLAHYEKDILPIKKGGRGKYNSLPGSPGRCCETAPETIRRTETKIIPFPGVSLDTGGGIQNILDDFLQEMGYID
jgi:hypothetical protein